MVKLLDFGLAEFVDSVAVTVESHLPLSKISGRDIRTATNTTVELPVDAASLRAKQAQGSAPERVVRIIGTPHYLAPEIWLGEPSTRQSDVYAMGAVLFELCAGMPPHYDPRASLDELRKVVSRQEVLPLTKSATGIEPRFAAIVERCLRRNPTERYASADELREALEELRSHERPVAPPEGNPYRGLFAFEAEHRSMFFGRSNEIGTVIERLRTEPFVLVAADSGIGKSSLCRAGILPLISEGALGGSRQWLAASLVPGRTPLAALATALAPILKLPATQLEAHLRSEPTSLGRDLHTELGPRGGVVLFIDQLEELVTIADPGEAEIVAQALGRLATRLPAVRMLMTARSDFLARIAALPGLGDELAAALYFLRPMYPEKIRQAIVGPAKAKGVRFESDAMVDTLVAETAKTEGGLPLLQFALTELWDARCEDLITLQSLEAIGGVSGALARHADQVVLGLSADRRVATRRILMLLVSMDGTRTRRTEDELGTSAAARQALEALVRARLIVAHATSDGIVYEVAHEALLKGWGTLRRWLEEFADSRAVKQRLEAATAEWIRLGRGKETLWSAVQLAELKLLDPADISAKEQAFIDASRLALKRHRLIRNVALVTVPLALALFYGGIQYKQSRDRSHKVAEHLRRGNEILAAARKISSAANDLRSQAFAAFEGRKKEEGESLWSQTLKKAGETEVLFGQASQAMEAALTIDPSRDDVRAMLADALFEGALAAERDRHTSRQNDLVQRMALYDVRGERQARWLAPARLTIDSAPAGAQVAIQQYLDGDQKRRTLGRSQELGRTPLTALPLPAGSYLLTFTLLNRAPVRYPIMVQRGESLRIKPALPALKDIPDGFVYVPEGRFLFGTTKEESVRQGFLSTVPVHSTSEGAYLIGRFEVTYADWLQFLNALPPAERVKRAIQVPKGAIGGGVELKEIGADRWQLTLQPVTQAYTVKLGEAIVYASRTTRREQHWLRMPVTGIGVEDVRAYADWLARSGRVPGARLCSEREWERAARGADDREFPHGDLLEPGDANFDETYGKVIGSAGPDMVGSYPGSESPFGLMDMAGNVFEWTDSSLVAKELVLRGGSYFMAAVAAYSTNRSTVDASFRDPGVGARICASLQRAP